MPQPRRRSSRSSRKVSSASSVDQAVGALLPASPEEYLNDSASASSSESTSDFAPSSGEKPAPGRVKKTRRGGRPTGRDPKKRRSQNVQSQKKYRDKRKDLAKIVRHRFPDVLYSQLLMIGPPGYDGILRYHPRDAAVEGENEDDCHQAKSRAEL